MNDFRNALGRFREAVRLEGERSEVPGLRAILERERRATGVRLRWAAAAAVVALALGAIPAYENAVLKQREAEQEKADALLMEQVNAGLSRSVARAMTPLMDWAPAGRGKD
jgi:cytochrome c-type biogenesis protein CcmH/NrfG